MSKENTELAPDIQEYLKRVTEGCEKLDKEYAKCKDVDAKLAFLYQSVKDIIVMFATREANSAHDWDVRLAELKKNK